MKKIIFILVFILGISISGFAQTTKSADMVANVTKEVSNEVKNAPSGTTYGLVGSDTENYVVNTPLGTYKVKKEGKNSISFMGITANLVSKKGNVYIIESSLGKFKINTNKCTVVKL